jgi:hypothetical protein
MVIDLEEQVSVGDVTIEPPDQPSGRVFTKLAEEGIRWCADPRAPCIGPGPLRAQRVYRQRQTRKARFSLDTISNHATLCSMPQPR